MIVTKNTQKDSSFFKKILWFWNFFSKPRVNLIPIKFNFKKIAFIVLTTIILWTFLLSVLIYRQSHKPGFKEMAFSLKLKGRNIKHDTMESFKAITLAPFNWSMSHFLNNQIPRIHIDIKFKNFQKLAEKREQALKAGFINHGNDDYVPAKIRYGNQTLRAKLRIKGDEIDHLEGDKWSFRIHVKDDNHLFGMRRFSIQNSRTRNYEGEILFFEALRREGVLVPRYFFVKVTVNGKDIGLMAFEESFSKELLEFQGRRESVIMKFDESNIDFITDNFKKARITSFQSKKISKSEKLSSDFVLARGLLRAFVSGTLPPSKVFDPVLMGRFIAVADVWRSWHALLWRNMRFYYNPITALLEPIGYDAVIPSHRSPVLPPELSPIIWEMLHKDSKIRGEYKKSIQKIAKEMREIDEGITKNWMQHISKKELSILHQEYPLLKGVRLNHIMERAKAALLSSQTPFQQLAGTRKKLKLPDILLASLINTKENAYLELTNLFSYPIEVHEIKCVTKDSKDKDINLSTLPLIKYPLYLGITSLNTLPLTHKIFYKKNEIKENCKIKVAAKIIGDDLIQWIEALPYNAPLARNPVPQMTLAETLAQHSFLKFKTGDNFLRITPGEWKVTDWIIIPEKMGLRIPKGTTLRFGPSFGLISHGPIIMDGTQKNPIVLTGNDENHKREGWQGIAVLNSQPQCKWSHVIIRDTNGINNNGWNLTGGINFYKTSIKMDNVTITGSQSEDALNIVRSKFKLTNVKIQNTTSDGLDSDFSSGVIEDGMFENIGSQGGGDGIDISGSKVSVIRTNLKNISDKALSVGEGSELKASDLIIKNVSIGAASKDGSRIFISDSKLTGIEKAGLLAYIKKSEYGPAEITAESLVFDSSAKQAIVQNKNKIIIDGVEVPSESLNVKELYSNSVEP